MAPIAEKHKVPGVSYAFSDEGLELPVIDLTHPAFASVPEPAELAALATRTLRRMKKSSRAPEWLLRLLARRSRLLRQAMEARGSFVSGMTTYLLKLGPKNLGRGWSGRLDRALASSLSPACMRVRLRDTAQLLAGGLVRPLSERAGPLRLINLGGGTAADSLNALLFLKKEHPELLAGRPVLIQVLDMCGPAPRFAARALSALREEGGALHGLDIRLEHLEHDWNDVAALRARLSAVGGQEVIAVSSEGGLFEYGSDEAAEANLAALREGTPADCAVVGSYLPDEPTPRATSENGKATNRLFDNEAFLALARRAGWALDCKRTSPLYSVVRLVKGSPG